MSEGFVIPEDALSEKFLAATGPGGQNVNKVATACQLRADVYKLGLSPEAYAKLKTIAGSRMTSAGELVITARRFRTQESNREDARRRLAEMIAEAHVVQALGERHHRDGLVPRTPFRALQRGADSDDGATHALKGTHGGPLLHHHRASAPITSCHHARAASSLSSASRRRAWRWTCEAPPTASSGPVTA